MSFTSNLEVSNWTVRFRV